MTAMNSTYRMRFIAGQLAAATKTGEPLSHRQSGDISEAACLLAAAAEEIDRLQENWADLQARIELRREQLRTPDATPARISKSQGLNLALDYMRGYRA